MPEKPMTRRFFLKAGAAAFGLAALDCMLPALTPTPTQTETPKPTPTLTPEPTLLPELKVERSPLPEYGVFTGDVFTVDEKSGAKITIGAIVIASIPQTEQNKPESMFFYYITNTRQLMPLLLPITKIEDNTVIATLESWKLQVKLIQPGIGKNVRFVLKGEIQGDILAEIEATQAGTCKGALERAIRSMKNEQLGYNIDAVRHPEDLARINISELTRRGIILPDSCPIPRLSHFDPLT